MTAETLCAIFFFSLLGGILCTKYLTKRREKNLVRRRLERWLADTQVSAVPHTLIRISAVRPVERVLRSFPGVKRLSDLLAQCGFEGRIIDFILLSLSLLILPPSIATIFDFDLIVSVCIGVLFSFFPAIGLVFLSGQRSIRFSEQLPDAIDLAVSVLKSGHSIPQAVKAVAEEMPDPLGGEFKQVMHRMNLGQPLGQALGYSCERFKSYELDLIRRAVSIQAEVGGSLAELLEKTNQTLRQRLKLSRQVRTLTAQSRLTALIVGLLPIILALALQFMSPGYLKPLLNTDQGRMFLMIAVVLQVVGLVIMKRLSTAKV